MSRIACLRIPLFPIVVQQKDEPELKGKPLVLLYGKASSSKAVAGRPSSGISNRSLVFACSYEAEKRGIRVGMRLSETRALCANLLWREYSPKLYMAAQSKLAADLISCSPKVSVFPQQRGYPDELAWGTFILDAAGLFHMGGESKFVHNALKLCSKAGYTHGRIGIADTAFAALVATRFKHRNWCIIPPGQDKRFLAPLSTKYLPAGVDFLSALDGLGLRSMGQLADLTADSLSDRFGEEGMLCWQLASGLDERQPTLPPARLEFQVSLDLGYAVESFNQTMFVLKSVIDHLSGQLKDQARLADELELAFFNDREKFNERTIRLIRSSNNAKFLLEVVKLSLDAEPLSREFTCVSAAVSRFSQESWEQIPHSLSLPGTSESLPGMGTSLPKASESLPGMGTSLPKASESLPGIVSSLPKASESLPGIVSSLPKVSESLPGMGTSLPKVSDSSAGTSVLSRSATEPLPEALILLLQRLRTRLGGDVVWSPVANDQHFPENAGTWINVVQNDCLNQIVPVETEYVRNYVGSREFGSGLAMRRAPQPIPVLVKLADSRPSALASYGRWYRVCSITEPECLSGLWWEQFIRKSYYVAALEQQNQSKTANNSSALVLLAYDHKQDGWFLEGFFD